MATYLNEQQLAAVRYISGPCLVIAGAGSGKTRVITEKIAYLISSCSYSAWNVCAVTFTNKAAKEMRERVSTMLPSSALKGLRVSTFHSLGLEIIRKDAMLVGLRPNFTLFDTSDQLSVIKELVLNTYSGYYTAEELSSTGITQVCRDISWHISRYKNNLLSPQEVLEQVDTRSAEYIDALIYQDYTQSLLTYNALDFDDLIFLTTKLLRDNEEVRNKWRNIIKYLLIDEYQDTNTSQYELVKLLVAEHEHFTVVGDDDQSIYSWRGAQPKNIALLSQDFPTLKVIMLEQNYRSCGRILKCANELIAHNAHEYVKKLYSTLEFGNRLRVMEIKSQTEEGKKIVADLLAHKYRTRSHNRDYAILYRSNYQSLAIEEALQNSNVPYRIFGDTSFFEQAEIKDMMSYLRLLATSDDNKAFLRIVNVPSRKIGATSIEHLSTLATQHNLSLFDACCNETVLASLKKVEAEKFRNFASLIKEIHLSLTTAQWENHLFELPKTLGYDAWLLAQGNDKVAKSKLKSVEYLLSSVSNAMLGDPHEGLEPISFADAVTKMSLREMLDRNEQDFELDEVQLMTLHSSKGLEFPYVYLIGMEEGLLPHSASIEADDVSEERRLAYVGITRAQRELTFTMCLTRKNRDKVKRTEPSRFLSEMPATDLRWEKVNGKATLEDETERKSEAMASIDAILALWKNE